MLRSSVQLTNATVHHLFLNEWTFNRRCLARARCFHVDTTSLGRLHSGTVFCVCTMLNSERPRSHLCRKSNQRELSLFTLRRWGGLICKLHNPSEHGCSVDHEQSHPHWRRFCCLWNICNAYSTSSIIYATCISTGMHRWLELVELLEQLIHTTHDSPEQEISYKNTCIQNAAIAR